MEPKANSPDIKYSFGKIQTNCDILKAIMLLEYHDMNYLRHDMEERNRIQRTLVDQIEVLVRDIKIKTIGIK